MTEPVNDAAGIEHYVDILKAELAGRRREQRTLEQLAEAVAEVAALNPEAVSHQLAGQYISALTVTLPDTTRHSADRLQQRIAQITAEEGL